MRCSTITRNIWVCTCGIHDIYLQRSGYKHFRACLTTSNALAASKEASSDAIMHALQGISEFDAFEKGTWVRLPQGGLLWTLRMQSEGALAHMILFRCAEDCLGHRSACQDQQGLTPWAPDRGWMCAAAKCSWREEASL